MARQQFLKQERITLRAAKLRHDDVRTSRAASSHVDRHRNIQFLSERKVGINGHVAGRQVLVLQPDLAHHFKTAAGEVLAQFIEWDALSGSQSVLESSARNYTGRSSVLPFLHAGRIPENNRSHIKPLHLSQHILHVFARSRRIKRWRALLFHPSPRSFFVFWIGCRELRSIRTHRLCAGEVDGMDMNVEHWWCFRVSVLGKRNTGCEAKNGGKTQKSAERTSGHAASPLDR